jgi:hypothetical protein
MSQSVLGRKWLRNIFLIIIFTQDIDRIFEGIITISPHPRAADLTIYDPQKVEILKRYFFFIF